MNPYNKAEVQAVWQRVAATTTAAAGAAAGDDPALLLDFLAGEQLDSRVYAALGRMVSGCDGAQLRRIAREKQCRAKRLAAAYFLMTGKRPNAEALPRRRIVCPAEELRSRYEAEVQDAEGYSAASRRFSGQTALMLEELAKGSLQYSRTVLCILENLI